VTAVLGGLGAAGAWALTTLCYSLAARTLDSASALALVMLVGFAIAAPATALGGVPHDLDADALGLLLLAGSANVAGLLLVITALRIGKVGIVAPIVSTEGALAAVIAVVAGEAIDPGAGATLALIATGIALASSGRDRLDEASDASQPTRAVLVAIAAALTFAVGLYATGKVSEELPLVWALLPARVIGVALIALPLLATGRLSTTRSAAPFVVTAGIAEVAGFAFFALGARDGIAITSVLASQFGVVAAIAAFVLFGERLTRVQTAGVVVIAASVAAITLIQT
jgi:drug/metabolite transporter (DMT)-like permease